MDGRKKKGSRFDHGVGKWKQQRPTGIEQPVKANASSELAESHQETRSQLHKQDRE